MYRPTFPFKQVIAAISVAIFMVPPVRAQLVTEVEIKAGPTVGRFDLVHKNYVPPPEMSPGWAFIPLPANLQPIQVSLNGTVLLADSNYYYRWQNGTLVTLHPAHPAGSVWVNPVNGRNYSASNPVAAMNAGGEIALNFAFSTRWRLSGSRDDYYDSVYWLKKWAPGASVSTGYDSPVFSYTTLPFDRTYVSHLTTNQALPKALDDAGTQWVQIGDQVVTILDFFGALDQRLLVKVVRINALGSITGTPFKQDFEYSSFRLNGISASGVAIGWVQNGSVKKYYVGDDEVNLNPLFINRNGWLIGVPVSGGVSFVQEPDGTRSNLPIDGYVEWIDDQNRLNGYYYPPEGGGQRKAVWIRKEGTPIAYDRRDYMQLQTPSPWSTNHTIAPGSTAAQLGLMTRPTDVGTETRAFLAVRCSIAVDANRDGVIKLASEDASDATSAAQPYRFWVNDDDDTEGTLMADGSNGPPFDEAEKTPVTTADYTRHKIGSKRNLEDFARLWMDLSGLQSMVTMSGGIQVGLKWRSVTGTPAVNLYVSADAAGSDGYLKIYQDFPNQLTMPAYNNAITFANSQQTVNTSGTFVFPLALLQTELQRGPVLHLLFEGAGVGTGQLIIVLLDKDGNPIGEGPGVWLDLKNIKTMYEQYRATPATLPRPFDSTTGPYDSGQVSFEAYPGRPTFQKPVDEEQKLLVFVNGSNETYAYSTSVAETLFKRLWWQGYKGRLVSFRWETLVGPFTGEIPAHYNLNEWLAWNWGKGLKDYLISSSAPSGYTVNVAAHSLGNTVVASALRLGMQASNVVLLQGAIPAGCFDTSGEINGFEDMLNKETNRPTPDFAAALGYRGFVTNAGGAMIHNFFNVQDYALSTGPLDAWEGNQELNKPDPLDVLTSIVPNMAYDYDATTSGLAVTQRGRLFNTQSFSVARFVATPYESMSFIARSRSKALGAKENVKGVITHEVAIGPNTPANLQNQRSDHSGEFTRPIQQLDAFYKEFIKDIGAAPIQ